MTTFDQIEGSELHTRTVHAQVSDAPEYRTPNGRAPMIPTHVQVDYLIGEEVCVYAQVRGTRADAGPEPKYHRGPWPETFVRYVRPDQLASAPEWLREFVETHRPMRGADGRPT